MSILTYLEPFKSTEGYWHKEDIFKEAIQDILSISKPKYMLEIGFNIGYSATMWLHHSTIFNTQLTSVDIGWHNDTIKASIAVQERYPERFEFILSDSRKVDLPNNKYDLVFIDGDHGKDGVLSDINLAVNLNIPYLVFDDWHIDDNYSSQINGVKITCDQHTDISLIKVYDIPSIPSKVALYKNELYSKKES